MKRIVSIVLAVLMLFLLLSSCADAPETVPSSSAPPPSSSAPETTTTTEGGAKLKLKIGWAPPNVTGVFETAENYMKLAIEDAKKYGIEIELVTIASPDETQFENQVKALENLMQAEADAIICSPGSADACLPAFQEINKREIPLILVNISEPPAGVETVSIVGFDNVVAGTVSGYALLDQLGGPGVVEPGEQVEAANYLDLAWWEEVYKDFDYSTIKDKKIAIIEGIAGSIYSNERLQGFHSVIDKCEGIEVVTTLAADWDREKGVKAAENILQSNEKLDAIWAASNEMGMGAAIAAGNMGRTEVLISTNDGTPESIQMIADGKLITETWHGFPEWGWYGVQFAVQAYLGQEVQPFFDIRPRTEYKGNTELFYPTTKLEPIPWEDILAEANL